MGANSTRLTPRQKMINLMYIVLTAMLALNVSSDVLDGFTQVHEGLNRSNVNIGQRNAVIYGELQAAAEQNPDKAAVWFDRATEVRHRTRQLSAYVDTLKLAIVRKADGADGNPANILNRDDLEAAAVVMLAPGNSKGADLRNRIDNYTEFVNTLISDSLKRVSISEALSTAPVTRTGTLTPQSWEEAKFDQQPVVAAITILAKLQSDILYAEGEALAALLSQVDAGDVRVNELNAYVMPQSRLVMRGAKYSANILLAAVDTTQRPAVYIDGKRLASDKGLYEVNAASTGNFSYNGWLEVPAPDGSTRRLDFSSSYTVIEPMATVSATLMNVLYAGIDNPMDISVPGVPMGDISATMTNGTLTRSGDHWVARPSQVGSDAVVTVTATMDGRSVTMAATTFRVRKLPDPSPFIAFKDAQGNTEHYKGGKPFPKASLMASDGLQAAIDDGLLNTPFSVESFETIFFDGSGNAMPEVSNGAAFSPRQKQQFQRMTRGKRFFISRIRAKGPDGITRDLSPMEVIVN